MDVRSIDANALMELYKFPAEYAVALSVPVPIVVESIADMPTLDLAPKWISAKERLPEKGEKVLVRGIKGGIQAGVFRGLSAPGRERMWHWKKNTCLEVVCWMSQKSLPEPPKEG